MSGGNSRSYCLPRWAGQGDRLGNPPWSNTRPARPSLGDTATGYFGDHFTDLSTPGRLPLTFTRTYNGSIADPTGPNASAAHDGPFGYGWTFSYNMSAATDPGIGNVTVTPLRRHPDQNRIELHVHPRRPQHLHLRHGHRPPDGDHRPGRQQGHPRAIRPAWPTTAPVSCPRSPTRPAAPTR